GTANEWMRHHGDEGQHHRGRGVMSIHSKLDRWRNVSRFVVDRVSDYTQLVSIELAQTRVRLVREIIALVAVAVTGLFTLSFVCIALIATAWNTPYFL